MTELPDKLRLIDGELVCADGSDLKAYLKAWAERTNVTADTPINIMRRDAVSEDQSLRHWAS
jgi:hypothetical protein